MGIQNALEEALPTSSSVLRLRSALQESLARRFGGALQDPMCLCATLLDPRVKLAPWASGAEDDADGDERPKEVLFYFLFAYSYEFVLIHPNHLLSSLKVVFASVTSDIRGSFS